MSLHGSLEKSRTEQLLKVSQRAATSVLTAGDNDHTHLEHNVHTSVNSSAVVPSQVRHAWDMCWVWDNVCRRACM